MQRQQQICIQSVLELIRIHIYDYFSPSEAWLLNGIPVLGEERVEKEFWGEFREKINKALCGNKELLNCVLNTVKRRDNVNNEYNKEYNKGVVRILESLLFIK